MDALVPLAIEIADGLDFAHSAGVIHRDLYAAQNCLVAEAVYGPGATVPALRNESGTAILNDMTSPDSPNRCTKH